MKLLFIGLDGLSFDIFEEFEMPFLHGLAGDGIRAKMISFDEPHMCTGPVWSSIQTGLPPEEHGVTEAQAGNWHTSAFHQDVKTIWRMLNENGVDCGVVNFPVTYPLRPVQKCIVCGFPAPWEHEGTENPWEKVDFGGRLFWPESVAPHIKSFRSAWMNYITTEEFPDTHEPYEKACAGDRQAQRYMMGLLQRSLHETARLTFSLMREFEVDLWATVFMETDTVGHMGDALPSPDRAAFLKEADTVVAEVVTEAQPENIVVMSDHGCWGKPHTREGTFVAAGPAFASADEEAVEVLQIPPTLLYLFDVYEPSLPREPAYRLLAGGQVDEADRDKIQDRLRAMGYLE